MLYEVITTRVLMSGGQPATNVYAAGEVMAGNILFRGYLAGFGMTIGTVFGRPYLVSVTDTDDERGKLLGQIPA